MFATSLFWLSHVVPVGAFMKYIYESFMSFCHSCPSCPSYPSSSRLSSFFGWVDDCVDLSILHGYSRYWLTSSKPTSVADFLVKVFEWKHTSKPNRTAVLQEREYKRVLHQQLVNIAVKIYLRKCGYSWLVFSLCILRSTVHSQIIQSDEKGLHQYYYWLTYC